MKGRAVALPFFIQKALGSMPDDYPWSSHPAYAMKLADNDLIDTDHVLRIVCRAQNYYDTALSRVYQQREAIGAERKYTGLWINAFRAMQFVSDVRSNAPVKIKGSGRQWKHSLEDIAAAIEKGFGVPIDEIRTRAKSTAVAEGRQIFCQVARELTYRNSDIAVFLRKDPALVTRLLQRGGKTTRQP